MWHITTPTEYVGSSKDYHERTFKYFNPKFYFYIRNDAGARLMHGTSTVWMDPDPLWSFGFYRGGHSIWYLNMNTFNYEEYIPLVDRPL